MSERSLKVAGCTQSAELLFFVACVVIKRLPMDVTAVEAGKDVAGWSANPSRNMRHEFHYATAAVARAVGGGLVDLLTMCAGEAPQRRSTDAF